MNGKRRPKAAFKTPAKASTQRIPHDDGAAWLVMFSAHCIVELEARAIEAVRALSTEQLRAIVALGLTDDGWGRVFAELAERGEVLA